MADKDKGKGVIIGDPWALDENTKIHFREFVAERTPSNPPTLGRVQEGDQAQPSVLRIADGLTGHH